MIDVVAALIWKNGKFLICQRPAEKSLGLLWEFVGGKVARYEFCPADEGIIKMLEANI